MSNPVELDPGRAPVVARATLAALLMVGLALASGPAAAQAATARPSVTGDPGVYVYVLRHQPVRDALALVLPLLSSAGSVEVRPGGKVLVLREQAERLQGIVAALEGFDRPRRQIEVALWIIKANRVSVSPALNDPELAPFPVVLERLREHLRYAQYRVVSSRVATGREGDVMQVALESGYRIGFELGSVFEDRRMRLARFEVSRQEANAPVGPPVRLLHSHLNLWLDRPLVVALSSGEGDGLLVVIQAKLAQAEPGSQVAEVP